MTINRKELFDDLSRLYNFNRNDAWVWLKEFIENQEEKNIYFKISIIFNFNAILALKLLFFQSFDYHRFDYLYFKIICLSLLFINSFNQIQALFLLKLYNFERLSNNSFRFISFSSYR